MRGLEADNDALRGVLPKIFGKPDFSSAMLGGLIDHFTNLNLTGAPSDFDLLGRVYEFFLGEFSAMQGKAGGEQYTPRGIVSTLVEMIEPLHGRVYDPCCGTAGFFIQSLRFVLAHSGRLGDLAIYGQERNPETYRLARMNLAIRGINSEGIRWNNEGTFLKDAHPDERFEFILANPPFNIKDWSGDLLREDARWKFGVPPEGNANFGWLQHIHHHLSANGYAAVVLANGSLTSEQNGEDIIRRAMIRMPDALKEAGLAARMLLQVHDELIFECPDAEAEETMKLAKRVMVQAPEPAVKLSVPLQVDARAAQDWEAAH